MSTKYNLTLAQATPPTPSSSRSRLASSTSSALTASRVRASACEFRSNFHEDDPQTDARSFKDAVATIRRTGVEFQYQLVVTRAYEEGEEQLLEEDAESELFVIVTSQTLKLTLQPTTSAYSSSTRRLDSVLVRSTVTRLALGAISAAMRGICGSLSATRYVRAPTQTPRHNVLTTSSSLSARPPASCLR